ncbi:MAG: class E sortase [Thermoanaerobaculia bacterium]
MLAGLGRSLIGAGVLILLFVVYQLWGTGLYTSRAQASLEDDFAGRLEAVEQESTTATSSPGIGEQPTSPTTVTPRAAPSVAVAPGEGEAAGRLEIPAIALDWIFVEGVSVLDLKKGPGHYPETPFPGQAGNAALAGHRTTYGAPFNRVDELEPGDEIVVTTVQGRFLYVVTGQQIVPPSQVEVLADFGDSRLTLTSCHPEYSARQRIIITARLDGAPAPAPPPAAQPVPPRAPASLDAGLSGDPVPKLPAVVWGLATAGIWLAIRQTAKRWRRWPSYLIGLPVFLVMLFLFFENMSRLLPANF